MGFTCAVESFTFSSSEDREITSVTGAHLPNKTNDEIKILSLVPRSLDPSNPQLINFFPRNLGLFFKNIETIYISYVDITTITKEDFQFLGNLKSLTFHAIKIKRLDAGVFDYMPNLEELDFYQNHIDYVEKGTFDKLNKLTTLNLQMNSCFDGEASDRAYVLEIIEMIESFCAGTAESLALQLQARRNAQIMREKEN